MGVRGKEKEDRELTWPEPVKMGFGNDKPRRCWRRNPCGRLLERLSPLSAPPSPMSLSRETPHWPENFCHHQVTIFSSHGKRIGLTSCNYCLSFLHQVHEDLCAPLWKTDSSAAAGEGTCEVHEYPQSSSLFRNQACPGYQLGSRSTTCD